MQAKFLQEGHEVDYTPSSDVAAGQVIVVNGHVRIARRPIPANTLGALATCGLFDVAKDSSNISDGNALYWDADGDPVGGTAGTGALTTTASGNSFFGFAEADAGVSATTVSGRLVNVPSSILVNKGIETLIADPGNAQAIPVTYSGYCPIVTAGSETRTLAIPTFIGQELLLYIKTDGGTCVITVASAINQTGNNTITMADVRDAIHLRAIESGANLVWDVLAANGAALSTV